MNKRLIVIDIGEKKPLSTMLFKILYIHCGLSA